MEQGIRLSKYTLYVDGGGTPTVRTYFSYKCLEDKRVEMNIFYLDNLSPNMLPDDCSIYDDKGLSTNNIAEWAALYYGLYKFMKVLGNQNVTIYQDSQLIVNQVNGEYRCKKEHLIPWLNAVRNIWWDGAKLEWVPRERIVKVLGH